MSFNKLILKKSKSKWKVFWIRWTDEKNVGADYLISALEFLLKHFMS